MVNGICPFGGDLKQILQNALECFLNYLLEEMHCCAWVIGKHQFCHASHNVSAVYDLVEIG